MMIYTCENCNYTFEAEDLSQCPDCGKYTLRPATPEEDSEYHKIRIELGYEKEVVGK